jgi:hypothetical protein
MIRWIEAGEKKVDWRCGSIFLDNLYSLTLGFWERHCNARHYSQPQYRVLGVFAMPIISVIMLQAFSAKRTLPLF